MRALQALKDFVMNYLRSSNSLQPSRNLAGFQPWTLNLRREPALRTCEPEKEIGGRGFWDNGFIPSVGQPG